MSNTYFVIFEIMDGENTYFQKELITVSISHPTDKDFIEDVYGELYYDSYNECWDISNGMGYPLVRVDSFQLVKEEDILILKSYGI